jgi:hypothetical protein
MILQRVAPAGRDDFTKGGPRRSGCLYDGDPYFVPQQASPRFASQTPRPATQTPHIASGCVGPDTGRPEPPVGRESGRGEDGRGHPRLREAIIGSIRKSLWGYG